MLCAACGEVLTGPPAACRCCEDADPEALESVSDMTPSTEETAAATVLPGHAEETDAQAPGSTLIEFPGARGKVPQWRRELSERVREIQQRRAREAALDAGGDAAYEHYASTPAAPAPPPQKDNSSQHSLGLVPTPPAAEAPEVNPLVAKALKRIERARQQQPPEAPARGAGASGRRGAAAAVARAADESYEQGKKQQTSHAPLTEIAAQAAEEAAAALDAKAAPGEPSRTPGLVAVPAKVAAEAPPTGKAAAEAPKAGAAQPPRPAREESGAPARAKSPQPQAPAAPAARPATRRVVEGVVDDAWLSRLEERILPPVNAAARTENDIAPLGPRALAGLLDLLAVAFLSSPFAAIIELTNGNWSDPRVMATMGAIILVVMFVYLTASTALAGRTWPMSLFGLYTVDAETALAPRLGQCVRRSVAYALSLTTLGLGILYALFDAERRTIHDHFSGTVVVRH